MREKDRWRLFIGVTDGERAQLEAGSATRLTRTQIIRLAKEVVWAAGGETALYDTEVVVDGYCEFVNVENDTKSTVEADRRKIRLEVRNQAMRVRRFLNTPGGK